MDPSNSNAVRPEKAFCVAACIGPLSLLQDWWCMVEGMSASLSPGAGNGFLGPTQGGASGGLAEDVQVLKFSGSEPVGTAIYNLVDAGEANAAQVTEEWEYPITGSVTARRLFVYVIESQSEDAVLTVRKNFSDTGITVAVPAGTTGAVVSDLVNTADFVAGNTIGLQVELVGGEPVGSHKFTASLELVRS